jgi:ABC-2 type transport system permease protein
VSPFVHGLETVWALCLRELLRFARERSSLYATLARPTLWLIVLGSGMRNAFREQTGVPYGAYMLPGVVTMTILFGGLFSGVSTVWDREFGFLKEVLIAPVPRVYIVLGKLLSGTIVVSLQALITLLFAPLVGLWIGPLEVLAIIGVVLLTATSVVAMALIIAARLKTFEGFSNLANLVALPLFFLSGSMYPIDDAPSWLLPLIRINPMTYAVDAMRGIAIDVAHHSVLFDLSVVSGFAAVMIVLATLSFRRAY